MFASIALALVLLFTPATPAQMEAPRESVAMSAMEVSAWESLYMIPTIAETVETETTLTEYVTSAYVADGYRVEPTQFTITDPYDDAIVHIFEVVIIARA